jgi:hypothetical protein
MSDIKIIKLDQNYLPGSNNSDKTTDVNLDNLIDKNKSSLLDLENLNENEINLPDNIISKHEFNLESVKPDNMNEIELTLDDSNEINLDEPISLDDSDSLISNEPIKLDVLEDFNLDDTKELSLDEPIKLDEINEFKLEEPISIDNDKETNLDNSTINLFNEINPEENKDKKLDIDSEIDLGNSVNSESEEHKEIKLDNSEDNSEDISENMSCISTEVNPFHEEHDNKLKNILNFYDNINHDKSKLHMFVLTGGSDKEIEGIMTTNYNINEQNMYIKTLEYINNINSDIYNEYLESLQSFYAQKKDKRNLKKNNYFIDENGSYITENKSTSSQEVIKPPKYFKTKDLIGYISNKLNNISYKIRNLRDYFLTINLDKKPKNYEVKINDFERLKDDYYKYYNNYQIFNQYNDLVNKITEDKNRLSDLIKLHNQERIKYLNMYSQISQLYTGEDPTSASVIIDDYLNSNSYKEIINSMEEIRNKNINNIDFVILELPEIIQQKKSTKKKKTLKLDLSEPTEFAFEPQSPDEAPTFEPHSPDEAPTFEPHSPDEAPTFEPHSPDEAPTDGNINTEGLHTSDELPEMADVLQDLKPENDLDSEGLPDVLKDTEGLDLDELPDFGDDIEGYQPTDDEMPETDIPESETLDVNDESKALSKSEEDETIKTIKLFDTSKPETETKKPKKSSKKKLVIKNKKMTNDVKDSGIIAKGKGKGKSKSKKIPKLLHEGNEKPCKFPFKKGKKYIKEEDGCVDGKTGKWCATEVDKDQDYKYTEWGYCKEDEE